MKRQGKAQGMRKFQMLNEPIPMAYRELAHLTFGTFSCPVLFLVFS